MSAPSEKREADITEDAPHILCSKQFQLLLSAWQITVTLSHSENPICRRHLGLFLEF
jgi:hypothetical protein